MAARKRVEQHWLAGDFVLDPGPGYRVEHFGEEGCSVGESDVLEMWAAEGALPPESARQRLPEVLLAAVHEEKGLAAVATTYLREVEQLGLELWHTRLFTRREHRRGVLGLVLIETAVRTHRERYESEEDARGAGMAFIVETEGIRRRFNQAVWQQPQATFIGEDSAGYHVRVQYFPGAVVPTSATPAGA
jgi:GNAT superfamily N-acetyltransferase